MQISNLEHLNVVESKEIQGGFGLIKKSSWPRFPKPTKPSKESYKPSVDIDVDVDFNHINVVNTTTIHQTQVDLGGYGYGQYQHITLRDDNDDIG